MAISAKKQATPFVGTEIAAAQKIEVRVCCLLLLLLLLLLSFFLFTVLEARLAHLFIIVSLSQVAHCLIRWCGYSASWYVLLTCLPMVAFLFVWSCQRFSTLFLSTISRLTLHFLYVCCSSGWGCCTCTSKWFVVIIMQLLYRSRSRCNLIPHGRARHHLLVAHEWITCEPQPCATTRQNMCGLLHGGSLWSPCSASKDDQLGHNGIKSKKKLVVSQ